MAILPVKKIHILGHKRTEQDLVNFLYRMGVVEVIETDADMNRAHPPTDISERSEERRVGKECRSRWSQDH